MVAQFSCQPGMNSTLYQDFLNTWWVGDSPRRRRELSLNLIKIKREGNRFKSPGPVQVCSQKGWGIKGHRKRCGQSHLFLFLNEKERFPAVGSKERIWLPTLQKWFHLVAVKGDRIPFSSERFKTQPYLGISHPFSQNDSPAEHADFSTVVSVSHHEACVSPGAKTEPCTMGKDAEPYTVLPCSALGTAALGMTVASAPSGLPLKIFAFGEPLTQVIPHEKIPAWHRVSCQPTMLRCDYTQPLQIFVESLSIRHWVREKGGLAFSHWSDTVRCAHPYHWLQDQIHY